MSYDYDDDWYYESERYAQDHPELVEFIQGLQDELTKRYKYIAELERQNNSMLRLIHMNDQKQALMEVSPEFAEEMKRLENGQS